MPRVSDEQKRFISSKFMDEKKTGKEIIEEFQQKFGYIPSASVINKYQYYNETVEEPTDDDDSDDDDKKKDKNLDIKTKDTRTVKGVIDFSDGEIPDDAFNTLCRNVNKSKAKVFDLLQRALNEGYTKVNIETGELSK